MPEHDFLFQIDPPSKSSQRNTMRNKTRLGKLIAVSAATVVTMAVVASSASAYGVAGIGKFNPAGSTFVDQGTITLTYEGQTTTCTVDWSHTGMFVSDNAGCSNGGGLNLNLTEAPLWNGGSPKVGYAKYLTATSPWGPINSFGFQANVIHGNQTTPTRIVANNVQIGTVYNAQTGLRPLYASVDMTIATSTGALVTVSQY